MKEKLKDNKGFTLVELIIVLAIMAIIGAIIVPNFITSTDKARLKSDIQSARVIQSAIGLYDAEQTESIGEGNINSMIGVLKEKGYISSTSIEEPQSIGAKWKWDKGSVMVDITGCDEKIRSQYDKLSTQEQSAVVNESAKVDEETK